MYLYVSLIQANKEECESREEAESERLKAKQRSAVLTEWERTLLPPQSEEVMFATVIINFIQTCLSYTFSYNSCLYR